MSEEHEEIKEIGEVTCPKCEAIVTIKKKTIWDRPNPRKKVKEEIYAEGVQTKL